MSPQLIEQEHAIEQGALATARQARTLQIRTEAEYNTAVSVVREIANRIKTVTDFFADPKKKAHDAWKSICAKEKEVLGPLDEAKAKLSRQIGAYQAERERVRQEEERKLREEAAREAEEVALAEAAELEALGETEMAQAVLEEATQAPAPVVVVAPAAPKAKGIASRDNWKFRVVDANKIPREFMTPDLQKIGQYVRAMKKDAKIAGVEVFNEASVSVRSN
jgi:hypothetical protein